MMPNTTAVAGTWTRPPTRTAAHRRAIEIAKRLDLSIETAQTEDAEQRHGRFWVQDLSLGARAGRADTLEGVLAILERYERQRPDGRPQRQTPRRWWQQFFRGAAR